MKKKFNTRLTKVLSNIYISPREEQKPEKSTEIFGKKSSTITFLTKKRGANKLKSRFEKGRNTYYKLGSSKKMKSRSKNSKNNTSAYSLKNTFAGSFCKKKSKRSHQKSLTKASKIFRARKKKFFVTQNNHRSKSGLKSCSGIFILINKKVLDEERKKQLEERMANRESPRSKKATSTRKGGVVVPRLIVSGQKEARKEISDRTDSTERSISDRDLLKNEISAIAYEEPSSRFLDEDTSDILQNLKHIAQRIKTNRREVQEFELNEKRQRKEKKSFIKNPIFGRKRLGVYQKRGLHFVKIDRGDENQDRYDDMPLGV